MKKIIAHSIKKAIPIVFEVAQQKGSAYITSLDDYKIGSDEYKYIRRLGRGTYGEVLKMKDSTGQEFALKIFRRVDYESGQTYDKAVKNEAYIQSSLDHPRIPKVYRLAANNENLFILMELIEGRTSSVPVTNYAEFREQILEVVSYLHNQGIYHCDIKNWNILDSERGYVLIDFGVSFKENEFPRSHEIRDGTPFYMAPETLITGYTPHNAQKADVYALGVTLLMAKIGEDAIQREIQKNGQKLHRNNASRLIPSAARALLDPADPFDSEILSMLSHDPAQRPFISLERI